MKTTLTKTALLKRALCAAPAALCVAGASLMGTGCASKPEPPARESPATPETPAPNPGGSAHKAPGM